MTQTKPYHLAWFLSGTNAQSFGKQWSGAIARDWWKPDLYVDIARALERARFDYLLMEDNVYVPDAYGGSMDFYVKNALNVPRRDPTVFSPVLLGATRHLGIVPTVSTFAQHPYLLARQIATLDQLSEGRAGWNVVTGSSDRAVQNFGLPHMDEHDARYDAADEFVEIANGLWESWAPDSIVADAERGIFGDPAKVRTIDYEGRYFSSRGPLNTGPLPQGRPVMAQAGSSPRGRDFAARWADTIVGDTGTVERMKSFRDDIRERMAGHGRNPDDCKVLFMLMVTLGGTEEEAQERYRQNERDAEDQSEIYLATISKMTGIDFGSFDLDEPLRADTPFETNGTVLVLEDFLARNEGRTLRQAGAAHGLRYFENGTAHLVGTPDSIAARMTELMEIGGDGFLLRTPQVNRRSVIEVCDGLVPALQRRGAVRTEYLPGTLRDNLLAY